MDVIKQEVLDKIASSEDISPTGKAWHEGFTCALSHVGLIDSLELETCLKAIKEHFSHREPEVLEGMCTVCDLPRHLCVARKEVDVLG